MSSDDSVTHWFEQVREGDSCGARNLWDRFFPDLVRLARAQLRGTPCRAADEEDVAASVLESLFRAAEHDRFPNLADRHDLWRLLLWMTARKVVDLQRRETSLRRGGGRVMSESALGKLHTADEPASLAEIIGVSPTPEFAATMVEQCQLLLERLSDSNLRAIALGKLEGYTNEEIATRLECSLRTVERRLHLIRKKWKGDGLP